MCRLICAFVVCIWQKQVFLWRGSFVFAVSSLNTVAFKICMLRTIWLGADFFWKKWEKKKYYFMLVKNWFRINSLKFLYLNWCGHHSTFIFDQILVKLADNQDRHNIWDKFKFWPHSNIFFWVTCRWVQKKMKVHIFNLIFVKHSDNNDRLKSGTNLNLGQIRLFMFVTFSYLADSQIAYSLGRLHSGQIRLFTPWGQKSPYRNDPKFSDRYAWANRSSLIWVCTVCHSVCIVWTHYSMVEPHSSNFRMITTNVLGVRIFLKFTVFDFVWSISCFPFIEFLWNLQIYDKHRIIEEISMFVPKKPIFVLVSDNRILDKFEIWPD